MIVALRGAFARLLRSHGSYRLFRCLRCNARLPRPEERDECDACDVRCALCGEAYHASYKGCGEYTLRMRDATPEQIAALQRRLRQVWSLLAMLLFPLALYVLVRALR